MSITKEEFDDFVRARTDGNARLAKPVPGASLLMELTAVRTLWEGAREAVEDPGSFRIVDGCRIDPDPSETLALILSVNRELLDDFRPKFEALDLSGRENDEDVLKGRVFIAALAQMVDELEALLEPAPAPGL